MVGFGSMGRGRTRLLCVPLLAAAVTGALTGAVFVVSTIVLSLHGSFVLAAADWVVLSAAVLLLAEVWPINAVGLTAAVAAASWPTTAAVAAASWPTTAAVCLLPLPARGDDCAAGFAVRCACVAGTEAFVGVISSLEDIKPDRCSTALTFVDLLGVG